MGAREFGWLLGGLSESSRYRQWLAQRPAGHYRDADESAAFLRSMR